MKVRIGLFLITSLLLVSKYSSRLSKSKPLLSRFIVKLKRIEGIEHYIAKKFSFHEEMENHQKMIF